MPTVLHPVTSCHNKREFHEKLNNLPIEKGNFLLYKNCKVANFIRTIQRRDGIFKEPSFCKNSHVENIVARWWTLEMFCSSCLENKTNYVSFFFLFNRKRLRHIVSQETLQISSWDCKFFYTRRHFSRRKIGRKSLLQDEHVMWRENGTGVFRKSAQPGLRCDMFILEEN